MTSNDTPPDSFHARMSEALAGRATVRIAEAASLLNMTEKTLRRHVADGTIAFRAIGTGNVRVRREFALSDLVGFYDARRMVGVGRNEARGRPVLRAGTGMTGFLAVAASSAKSKSRTSRKRV